MSEVWTYDGDVRIGLYPDAHVFPGHDSRPVTAIARWFAEMEVDIVVNIGDFNDMGSLSSYDKGTKKIEGKRVRKDLDYGKKMLDLFREGLGGHDPELVMTLGNHENRLFRWYDEEPQMADLVGDDPFGYEEAGYTVFEYLDILNINGIRFSHAFANPKSLTGGIQGGSADIRIKNIGFPHVQGHQHGPLIHKQEFLGDGTPMSTLVMGCAHTERHAYWGRGREVYCGAAVLDNVRGGSYDLNAKYIGNLIRDHV